MEISEIIFDEEKDLGFTDERFIRGESEVWQVSQLLDGTTWDNLHDV